MKESDYQLFRDWLRYQRKYKFESTRSTMAKHLRLRGDVYTSIEDGSSRNIPIDNIFTICESLDFDFEQLVMALHDFEGSPERQRILDEAYPNFKAKQFGVWLKFLREKELEMTEDQLCKLIKSKGGQMPSRKTEGVITLLRYKALESGKIQAPEKELIETVCIAVGVEVDELDDLLTEFSGDGPKSEQPEQDVSGDHSSEAEEPDPKPVEVEAPVADASKPEMPDTSPIKMFRANAADMGIDPDELQSRFVRALIRDTQTMMHAVQDEDHLQQAHQHVEDGIRGLSPIAQTAEPFDASQQMRAFSDAVSAREGKPVEVLMSFYTVAASDPQRMQSLVTLVNDHEGYEVYVG